MPLDRYQRLPGLPGNKPAHYTRFLKDAGPPDFLKQTKKVWHNLSKPCSTPSRKNVLSETSKQTRIKNNLYQHHFLEILINTL